MDAKTIDLAIDASGLEATFARLAKRLLALPQSLRDRVARSLDSELLFEFIDLCDGPDQSAATSAVDSIVITARFREAEFFAAAVVAAEGESSRVLSHGCPR